MSINVTPIPRLIDLAAPAFTLGTANAAGSAVTAVASDATLLAFDTTAVDAITFGQSGSVGSATVSSRRDHAHAMEAATAHNVLGSTLTNESRTAAAATGDVSYTGAGFRPTAILVWARDNTSGRGASWGYVDDAANDSVVAIEEINQAGAFVSHDNGKVAFIADAHPTPTNGQTALVKSIDADGVTLTWTKFGSGKAVLIDFLYMAAVAP